MKKSIGTILLAEDNEHDIELTLSTLDSFRLANKIKVVRDGAEALDYLLCKGEYESRDCVMPSVILLDIKMPKVDGLQVLEIVKTHPELKSVPVVMLTSSRQEIDLVRSYALGVNAYVVKPVDYEQFSEAIKQLGVFWALINETPNSSACTTED
jgi:CheY-like chemotaxis protein